MYLKRPFGVAQFHAGCIACAQCSHAGMLAHNAARTPLCILHQICWRVVRAVIVLPTLNLLEQYAVTHRSKLWGRVVARCYALDDGLPPKALRNLDLLALDTRALAGTVGQRIDFTNMVDAMVVSTYNGVLVEPVPVQGVYTDLIHLNRTGSFGNAIFRTLRMDARGKEWLSERYTTENQKRTIMSCRTFPEYEPDFSPNTAALPMRLFPKLKAHVIAKKAAKESKASFKTTPNSGRSDPDGRFSRGQMSASMVEFDKGFAGYPDELEFSMARFEAGVSGRVMHGYLWYP